MSRTLQIKHNLQVLSNYYAVIESTDNVLTPIKHISKQQIDYLLDQIEHFTNNFPLENLEKNVIDTIAYVLCEQYTAYYECIERGNFEDWYTLTDFEKQNMQRVFEALEFNNIAFDYAVAATDNLQQLELLKFLDIVENKRVAQFVI